MLICSEDRIESDHCIDCVVWIQRLVRSLPSTIAHVRLHKRSAQLDKSLVDTNDYLCSILPPHMNIHLAKLHIHVFLKTIYGFEVKVFHNISGVGATKFPNQLEVYMCCRPRASLPYTFYFCICI